MHGFTPRAVPRRGFCAAPTDPAKRTTHGLLAGIMVPADTSLSFEGDGEGASIVTVTNTGNVAWQDGSGLGFVYVDAAGTPGLTPYGTQAVSFLADGNIAPGQSSGQRPEVCGAWGFPQTLRLRLADEEFNTFLSPVLELTLTLENGNVTEPSGTCAGGRRAD
jgi:hypothetical protein